MVVMAVEVGTEVSATAPLLLATALLVDEIIMEGEMTMMGTIGTTEEIATEIVDTIAVMTGVMIAVMTEDMTAVKDMTDRAHGRLSVTAIATEHKDVAQLVRSNWSESHLAT